MFNKVLKSADIYNFNFLFKCRVSNLVLKMLCAESLGVWLYEKSALKGFCGITIPACKSHVLHSALSIALSSEEKPINLSTQATGRLTKGFNYWHQESKRFCMNTNAKSWNSTVMRQSFGGFAQTCSAVWNFVCLLLNSFFSSITNWWKFSISSQ